MPNNALKERPQAIIFDWDGTLVNTLPGIKKAHNHVRTSLGHAPWTEEEFRQNLKHSSRELYPQLYGDQAEAAFETLYNFIENNHTELLDVLDGAQTLLEKIHSYGIPMALVSNKTHKYLLREVGHLGWDKYFFAVLGAGQAERDKPAPDPLYMALKAATTPIDTRKTLFVGDTETDLSAGQIAQCRLALMLHGEDKTELVTTYRPDYIFNDCEELGEEIGRLFG